ncbi:MAG: biotin synthase BioB [Archangium sp.]|nr:biotin synthase BioB [Archangium sp.]
MTPGITAHAHTEPTSTVPLRHDWTVAEVRALYDTPLLELVYRAQTVHRAVWKDNKVQLCSLLSIKTGGCSEDCAYCPQSARYKTGVQAEKLMSVDTVLEAATKAREAGATRFCMGAAWREVKDGPQFDSVLDMVRGVKSLGLEACCTLGMVTDSQVARLKSAGLDAYNHNLDTGESHYADIISTRTYQQRLATIERVRKAGISVCAGGIIGMGESIDARCELLVTLANQSKHPDSVPINALVAVKGTPLEEQKQVDFTELVRMVAVARLMMPAAMVRLSAGRKQLSAEAQLLCMMAGANSVFFGDTLLTTDNPDYADDMALFEKAGVSPLDPNVDLPAPV